VYTAEFYFNTFKLHCTTNICTIYMSRVPKGVYRRPKVILSIPTWVGCATHINSTLGPSIPHPKLGHSFNSWETIINSSPKWQMKQDVPSLHSLHSGEGSFNGCRHWLKFIEIYNLPVHQGQGATQSLHRCRMIESGRWHGFTNSTKTRSSTRARP
jgi:hypothetical protein